MCYNQNDFHFLISQIYVIIYKLLLIINTIACIFVYKKVVFDRINMLLLAYLFNFCFMVYFM